MRPRQRAGVEPAEADVCRDALMPHEPVQAHRRWRPVPAQFVRDLVNLVVGRDHAARLRGLAGASSPIVRRRSSD
jgi:hypothetical protein